MKINAPVIAGVGVAILAGNSPADFTGLFIDSTGTTTVPGPGFLAFHVYACFNSPTDRLLSVTGASLSPLGGAQFYQNPFGGATEPSPALLAFFPDLQWDTFVTINRFSNSTLGPWTPATALEPGSSMTSSGFVGGWFTDGDAPQGLGIHVPGQPGFYVLLMQLTIQNPTTTSSVGGSMTIAWKTATSGAQFAEVEFSPLIDGPVPAAGALPLLAIAGLAGSRRRC